jgi:hypothetical protein
MDETKKPVAVQMFESFLASDLAKELGKTGGQALLAVAKTAVIRAETDAKVAQAEGQVSILRAETELEAVKASASYAPKIAEARAKLELAQLEAELKEVTNKR